MSLKKICYLGLLSLIFIVLVVFFKTENILEKHEGKFFTVESTITNNGFFSDSSDLVLKFYKKTSGRAEFERVTVLSRDRMSDFDNINFTIEIIGDTQLELTLDGEKSVYNIVSFNLY